jgi:hypothetical protein
MRALSASVVLSTMVLGGCLTVAKAQDLDVDNPPSLNSDVSGQTYDSEDLAPGEIPQPSIDAPGLVMGVTVGQLYTDNVRLGRDGQARQSGWITQVQPFVRAATQGPRFNGTVDYRLSGYLYEQPSGHNQLSQLLDANGTLAILPQHFFLAGSARYGQQIINNQLPGGGSTFFLNGNRANVGTAMLSPYWVQDFGRAGTMMLRYTSGRVVYNRHGISGESPNALNGIPNVTINAAQFDLKSPKYETWGWDLGYSEERIDPDFGRSFNFAMARIEGSYKVNDHLRLLADVGKETRFRPDGSVDKLGSPFWDAGFEWSSARNSVRLTAGHRFFGKSYELSWTHQAALLTTNVSYVERPTTYNRQLAGFNFGLGGFGLGGFGWGGYGSDGYGSDGYGSGGSELGGTGSGGLLPVAGPSSDIPSLTEREPYLSKRLSASATYLMPKSHLSLRVYDELRTYFVETDRNERVVSANLAWSFNLGPSTTLTPSARWARREFRDGQTNNNRTADLALVHQFNAKDSGSVRLRHRTSEVDSPVPGAHSYTVNVLFVQWTHLF